MNILIVDDEAPARQRLRALLDEIGAPCRVVGEAANGLQALGLCESREVDLVLMDIQMPGMDGLEAASRLAQQDTPPAVVFVTAFEEHALEAYQGNAADYLLKPIRRRRLKDALQRAVAVTRPQLQALQARPETTAYLSTSYRGGIRRIPIDEVIYLMADQKYVTACHTGGEALLEESLKSLEQRFGQRFFRIHRNALVSRQRLIALEKAAEGRCLARLKGSERRLEISRRHLPEVRQLLKSRT